MSQVEVVRKISNYLQVPAGNLSQSREKVVTRTLDDKTKVSGFCTVVSSLAGKYRSVEEECLTRQWLEYCSLYVNSTCLEGNRSHQRSVLEELNEYLATRSYFVGNSLSLADVAVFYSIATTVETLQNSDKEHFVHLSRWFDHVQLTDSVRQDMSLVNFSSLRSVR
ncbi:eukaryotic translation elongation factor 1 epsilon-1 [Phlebotomus argentipes]|uniref:eukaryotic translation elongation factor 1 epsilon-1 n=1 Tax=Phlebotomus argentipes TaxID=94469 RepID=UPI0028936B84|nr:eukaryotic translation elongation factor 1 epsilon-1 [Phlebotomus argentipes]